MTRLGYVHDDGDRAATGYRGTAGDCVTRAVAIATRTPYSEAYDHIHHEMRTDPKLAGRTPRKQSPRNGVPRSVFARYLTELGWVWHPTMTIGSGTTVHLRADELPSGRLVVRCSRHLVAVIDGVIHDTHNPDRDGTRAVYGYWTSTPAA